MGQGAIESILESRKAGGPFASFQDLAERIDLRLCNKRVVEALIAAGALDQLAENRAQLMAVLDSTLREAQLRQADREAGQGSLFGDADEASVERPGVPLPEVPPWPEAERLSREKEVLGFFISGHPLERYRDEVALFGTRTTATLGTWSEHPSSVGAVVTAVSRKISRKTGAEYARLTLEDFHGTAEAIVFPDTWSKLSGVITPDAALLLEGGYSPRDRSEDRAPFIVHGAMPLGELRADGSLALTIAWRTGAGPDPDAARRIAAHCLAHPGRAPVLVEWSDGNGTVASFRSRALHVELDEGFLKALRNMAAPARVTLSKAR